MKVGLHTGNILERLNHSTSAVLKPSSISVAGTKLLMSKYVADVNITPVELLLLQRQLRWLEHLGLIRIPSNHLPSKVLYG